MLTMLLALLAAETSKQIALPLPSAARIAPAGAEVNLTPRWHSTVLHKQLEMGEIVARETNLEQWCSLLTDKRVVSMTPTVALEYRSNGVSMYRYRLKSMSMVREEDHRPWHLAIQSRYPHMYAPASALYYQLVKAPTMQKPYYEAVVCAMPNIRCKAKTLELLHQELLRHYASYLETMMEEETDNPPRLPPASSSINHSLITWMLDFDEYQGARYGSGITQSFSFTTVIDY